MQGWKRVSKENVAEILIIIPTNALLTTFFLLVYLAGTFWHGNYGEGRKKISW
jgi:hypothetical protein